MIKAGTVGVATLALLALDLVGPVTDVHAQSTGEIQVLVAPLSSSAGVNSKFGEKVAGEVRKAVGGMPGMAAFPESDLKKSLKEFKLDPQQMSHIEWRQLGSRLGVQLVMVGTAESAGSRVKVDVTFVDPTSGDELPVSEFTVASDKKYEDAAIRIAAGLETQVAYTRAIIFCAEYLGSKQFSDALRNCNKALDINSSSIRAWYLRGRTHMEAEEWELAAADLEKVVADNPSNTDAIRSLAFAHAQLGNTERSLELYQEYLTFQPDDAQVRLSVAFQLAQAGAYAAAMEILQEGVERDPENADLWEYLGNVALAAAAAGNGTDSVSSTAFLHQAVRAFDKLLELKQEAIDPAILRNAIAANLEIGDLDAALQFSERALTALRSGSATSPDTAGSGENGQTREQVLAGIHSLRADIFTRRDQLDRALAELDRTLEADPGHNNAYMKRGFLRLRTGNTQGAMSDYQRAVDEGGQDPNAIGNQLFGTAYQDYFQKRRYSAAIDMLKTALRFARLPQLTNQINFFTAFSYYEWATNIDQRNEAQEACGPAQQALSLFRNVIPILNKAGSYQPRSQAQIREAIDVQLFRQQQIIKARCR